MEIHKKFIFKWIWQIFFLDIDVRKKISKDIIWKAEKNHNTHNLTVSCKIELVKPCQIFIFETIKRKKTTSVIVTS